jgi:hypothetical protein
VLRNPYRILVGKPKGRDHLGGLGGVRKILKWVINK